MTISVLLIGDNYTVLDELQRLLGRQPDMDLISVTHIQAAADVLNRRKVDVIVLDTQLPTLNGIKSAAILRSASAVPPLILLSLQSDVRYVKASFNSGVAGYLLREYAYEELAEAVRVVVDGHCYLSPLIAEVMTERFLEERCKVDKI